MHIPEQYMNKGLITNYIYLFSDDTDLITHVNLRVTLLERRPIHLMDTSRPIFFLANTNDHVNEKDAKQSIVNLYFQCGSIRYCFRLLL